MKIITGLFFLLLCNFSFAQGNDDNWVFGHHCGLNFNTGVPVPFTTNIFEIEDCASISDTSGQLQFFTNGVKIFDRNGNMMLNGDSMATDSPWQYGDDVPQPVVILPMPGTFTQYYVFMHTDSSIHYSIVDMTLNSGLGYVVIKNQLLYNAPTLRYMTAIKHANGSDWWLIAHGLGTNFMAYEITPSGIQPPVISPVGIQYNYAGMSSNCHLVSNLQGNQLALSSAYGIHLVNFDRCTGVFSNFQTITSPETPYDFAFSPDGTKLYYAFHYNQYPTYLYQMCLDCGLPLDSNIMEIYHDYNLNYDLGQIQNAPDGKIYVEISYWWPTDTTHGVMNMNLSVINNPDSFGLVCNFDTATISLGGNWTSFGLPNSPYYNMSAINCADTSSGIANHQTENEFEIYPNPTSDKIYFPQSGRAELRDVSGKIILEEKNCSNLNVAELASGIYFLNLYLGNGNVVHREIIKN